MRPFLVCYDYGQGGNWQYVSGESAECIKHDFPSVTVFDTPPQFWDEDSEVAARKADPDTNPFSGLD
jgi:hypothetical protein